MRILLAANASYSPPRGGATRSNLVWLDRLAAQGNECRVVAAALDRAQSPNEPVRRGAISIWSGFEPAARAELVRRHVRDWLPDRVLVSSEDIGQVLLREALELAPGRVVYLAHTPQFFPFGPESWSPSARGGDLMQHVSGIVAIGRHMADYVERHCGRRAEVIHPPIYGPGPFRRLASFDSGLITMINPCAIKGLPIFLELARRFPRYRFGALPGWGTTAADRAALAAEPSIELLPPCDDIEDFLVRTRVLVMPSLWYEGFGLIVVEAMLRGVPVISSDSGGLAEAKLGTHFVIPVRPIGRYENEYDEHSIPRAVVPEQDLEPWVDALRALTEDRGLYERESEAAARAASEFVTGVEPDALGRYLERLAPAAQPLRILLAHNSTYFPAHGGGDRSNRLLMEALAARGHRCRVVARTAGYGAAARHELLEQLAARGIASRDSEGGVVAFEHGGVEVRTLADHANMRGYFAGEIEGFAPDVILASTDDPAQVLVASALRSGRPLVYLARATLALPFGPDCAFPSEEKTAALRSAAAFIGVSEYVASYARREGGIDAVHLPISLLESGPWPALGSHENEFVLMVNPCAVKGIDIFLAMTEAMPEIRFAAVPTWGANAGDLARLGRHPNVTLLAPADNVDDVLSRARVLLVPSVWAEARSRIVVEAMLRGVPVVASDVGGIREAKLGVDYLLPVRPIKRYRPELDERMVPVAEVPPQDVEPWIRALRRLIEDPAHWKEISDASRRAAVEYARGLSVEPFERLLREVVRRPRTVSVSAEPPAVARPGALDSLSPEKRALLALRLRKKAEAGDRWFPGARTGPRPGFRLFAFPHAGGGASAFAGWADLLSGVKLCPVRLPGRENRTRERPFEDMDELVSAVATAIQPYLDAPFAFFGHSMGAAVAFELARRLRASGQPAPRRLIAAAARAPRYRLNYVPGPDPTDEELLQQLRKLEGVPAGVLDNHGLLEFFLPALRADMRLYRRYVYREAPPLDLPVYAYGGCEDPDISEEHLAAWAGETSGPFVRRLFPGGHFFPRAGLEAFLAALAEDLRSV